MLIRLGAELAEFRLASKLSAGEVIVVIRPVSGAKFNKA
jgi:hypothetical protein